MAETKCPACDASLESEDEICGECEAAIDSVQSPSLLAPPPPSPSGAVPGGSPQTVADIMTRKVATLFEGESLEEAEKGFRTVRFRHVPVVGSDGFFIGLLSQRDLLRALPSPLDPDSDSKRSTLLRKYRVGDIMARNVRVITADTSLEQAGVLMVNEKRDCLPVVDEKTHLIGIVTSTDFVKLAVALLQTEKAKMAMSRPPKTEKLPVEPGLGTKQD